MNIQDDNHYMRTALDLARRGLGRVWPNPSVGCVIVRKRIVIGRGVTGDGGRPHAETQALEQAGRGAKGATVYVSFEPCAHHGKTPPCAEALIEAGVKTVVTACLDPDPRVAGRGLESLRAAGIGVREGVLAAEAEALNRGFILRVTEGRPLVSLKTATTLDGKAALPGGESLWITGKAARRRAHLERARHDAVLIGAGTALRDDPLLDVRVSGLAHKGVRIILDTHLRITPQARLVQSARDGGPVWIVHADDPEKKEAALEKAGVRLIRLNDMAVETVLRALAAEGITRLLVEGGPTVHGAFLKAGFCDRLLWFRAPAVMGEGMDAVRGLETAKLETMRRLRRVKIMRLDQDLLEIYEQDA